MLHRMDCEAQPSLSHLPNPSSTRTKAYGNAKLEILIGHFGRRWRHGIGASHHVQGGLVIANVPRSLCNLQRDQPPSVIDPEAHDNVRRSLGSHRIALLPLDMRDKPAAPRRPRALRLDAAADRRGNRLHALVFGNPAWGCRGGQGRGC